MKRLFPLLILFFGITSCRLSNEQKKQLIQSKVQENVAAFIAQKKTICYNEAQEIANTKVDSILLQEARDASIFQLDSIYIQGYRPIPPSKPAIKTPKDTAPVEYLFDNN